MYTISITFDILFAVKIVGIDIDSENVGKLQKHGVPIKNILKFFNQEFLILSDPKHSKNESRFWGFGIVDDERIFIVFTIRANDGILKFRPISARKVHKKEWQVLNEKINGKKDK